MYYGIDLGGTKIEFGAFDNELNRVYTLRVPTPANDYPKLIKTIVNIVLAADKELNVNAPVGIGIPGIESPSTNKLLTVNVPAANGKSLRKDLEDALQRTVSIENDANCFALSEAWDNELKEYPSVLGLIMGTGFGGGIVLNGRAISGLNHVAGELGHLRLPYDAYRHLGANAPIFNCGCGNQGCLDNYLSGRGFESLYKHFYHTTLSAKEIINDYYAKEVNALEHVERFLELTAICFANLFTSIDPHAVVLGGGLSNFELLYEELPRRIKRHLMPIAKPPVILKAKWGDSGGVRGAAFLNI